MASKTRERRFLELIGTMRSEIDDLKQRRPVGAAPTVAHTVQEAGVVTDDSIATTTTTNPALTYGDPERGYGRGEWGDRFSTA